MFTYVRRTAQRSATCRRGQSASARRRAARACSTARHGTGQSRAEQSCGTPRTRQGRPILQGCCTAVAPHAHPAPRWSPCTLQACTEHPFPSHSRAGESNAIQETHLLPEEQNMRSSRLCPVRCICDTLWQKSCSGGEVGAAQSSARSTEPAQHTQCHTEQWEILP